VFAQIAIKVFPLALLQLFALSLLAQTQLFIADAGNDMIWEKNGWRWLLWFKPQDINYV